MKKVFSVMLTIATVILLMAFKSYKENGFEFVSTTDTIFNPELPDVEFRAITYNNYNGVTTAGFEVVVRQCELEITGAELYKASSEHNINKRYDTFYPLRIHLGDSTRINEIQRVRIYPRFPFTQVFYEEDSLVLHTDRGNRTICLPVELRKNVALRKINRKTDEGIVE